MKVPLDRPGEIESQGYGVRGESTMTSVNAVKSLPFWDSPMQILVHRVRRATAYYVDGEFSHLAVQYWCGNNGHSARNGRLLERPPKHKLVCERCEAMVKQKGLPSSDSLVGHHVHVGRAQAVKTCCTENN